VAYSALLILLKVIMSGVNKGLNTVISEEPTFLTLD